MDRREFLRLGTLALMGAACGTTRFNSRKHHSQKLENHTVTYIMEGNPAKPPLLFLHGKGRSPEMYSLELLTKDYHVIAPKIYGMDVRGKSPTTLKDLAYLTAEFCKALKISDAHIIGQSTGGTVPWLSPMHEFYTDLVSVNPILPVDYNVWGFARNGLVMNINELFGRVAGTESTKIALRDIQGFFKAIFSSDRKNGLGKAFAEDLMKFELWKLHMDKPMLMLYGTQDELFKLTPKTEEQLCRAFPRIRIERVSAEQLMNHDWMIFYPERAYDSMRRFHEDIRSNL